MKQQKYEQLNELKGFLRARQLSYRQVSALLDMRVQTFSNILNGYSEVNTTFIAKMCNTLDIPEDKVIEFFLPGMLRNETKDSA